MSDFKHVMVAVDLSDDATELARRGLAIARRSGARFTLLNVVNQRALTAGAEVGLGLFGLGPPPAGQAGKGAQTEPQPVPFSTDDRLMQHARDFLDTVASHLGEDARPEIRVVASSSLATEIVGLARRLDVDLLVCGSHHRHGLSLFLPTAIEGVVHHLPCDVLLVRLP